MKPNKAFAFDEVVFPEIWQVKGRDVMARFQLAFAIFSLVFVSQLTSAATPDPANDWSAWRGPYANGKAAENQTPPTSFGENQNVLWKVSIPGRGHSSPVIVGDQIFLTTADERRQVQGAICFDKNTGKQLWMTPIHKGNFPSQIHKKNTHASGTVACNGDNIFTVFYNQGQIKVTALSLSGKILWSKSAGRYNPTKFKFGYGASPLLYEDVVIATGESDKGSFITAFNQKSGAPAWKIPRKADISFSSPIIANVAGRDQLLISGLFEVSSYDPKSGKKLWSVPGTTQATCGTMVWDGNLVFASGGYPESQTIAVNADGSGVAWKNNQKCYEQSMLTHDGYLYGYTDGGIAVCWRATDGREMWKARLGGNVSSSPILANGNIYVANEAGDIFIFKATPESYQLVTKTRLGSDIFPTPAFVDNKIFYRAGTNNGQGRQEYLYCIGEK